MVAQRPIFSLFEYKSTADHLKRCQLRSPISGINIWWSAAMLFTHHRRDLYSAARPSRRNYLITIWCGSVSGCGNTCGNWESIRDWLSVPPFSRTFLKSPSSRGLCHSWATCYFWHSALWHSGLSSEVPECQKLKVYHRLDLGGQVQPVDNLCPLKG